MPFPPAGKTQPLLLGVLVVLLFAYPFIEKKYTGDDEPHNILQRPRDAPVRSGLGAMALTVYALLTLSGGNDLIAYHFQISLNAMTWVGRIGFIVLPPIAYFITYRICLGLQRSDREVLEHGIETGIIEQLADGSFVEIHQPLGPVDEHGHAIPLEYQGAAVPKQMNELGFSGQGARGTFFSPDDPDIVSRVNDIEEQNHHEQKTMFEELQRANRAEIEDGAGKH